MKATSQRNIVWSALVLATVVKALAQTPTVIEYSGRVVVDGTNFNSTAAAPGFYKCVLLTRDGSTNTIWSNDGTPGNPWGTSLNGAPPNAAVELILHSESAPYVAKGHFKLRLGDGGTTPAINPSVLSDSSGNVRGEVYLRVWFSPDNTVFQRLEPDVKLASAPYAIWAGMAETVKDRAIGTNQLTDGAVTASKLAPGSVAEQSLAEASVSLAKLAQQVAEALSPPGEVTAFGGHTNRVPAGWLLCDGRAASSGQYPALYAAIGTNWGAGIAASTNDFNVPDLRGLFLRGVSGTRSDQFADPGDGRTKGNRVGSLQGDELRLHRHAGLWARNDSGVNGALGALGTSGRTGIEANVAPTAWVGDFGGSETRGKNAYVNYIIKF